MENLFIHSLETWQPLVYGLIFLGMIIEGDAVLFTAFFLVHKRLLNPQAVVMISIIGMLSGDILWYSLGRYLRHFPYMERKIKKISSLIDSQLNRSSFRAIFISKFTYGFHRITLTRSGAVGIPFLKYFKADVLATLSWVAMMGGLTYLFSVSILALKRFVRFSQIGLLIGVIILIFVSKYISRKKHEK